MLKQQRHDAICHLIATNVVCDQQELVALLKESGFHVAQATISRDLRALGITKQPHPLAPAGGCLQLPSQLRQHRPSMRAQKTKGFLELIFSPPLAIIRTEVGYAQSIAAEIDQLGHGIIAGTVAGSDTVLIVPQPHVSQKEVRETLAAVIPELRY